MTTIKGVNIKDLKVIPDERGRLMEIFRSDDPLFSKFGQVYMTTAYPGVVKAWHYHKIQTDHFAVVQGMIKLVLFDSREDSETKGTVQEIFMGTNKPILVQIPNGVYHGFKCIGQKEAIIINCPTEVYNYESPDEHRIDPHKNEIPYDWKRKDG
ncbi:dTDP-4-dehydrorhamnose 3,5-epimerase [archaeon]|nr:dTDP-4-dehydrorhamnose 3,5-epimerase [archaeon]|tara:strand:- start:492 stop:953 length:462 start_codon:yes stop_codon:yes gene_type:complete